MLACSWIQLNGFRCWFVNNFKKALCCFTKLKWCDSSGNSEQANIFVRHGSVLQEYVIIVDFSASPEMLLLSIWRAWQSIPPEVHESGLLIWELLQTLQGADKRINFTLCICSSYINMIDFQCSAGSITGFWANSPWIWRIYTMDHNSSLGMIMSHQMKKCLFKTFLLTCLLHRP